MTINNNSNLNFKASINFHQGVPGNKKLLKNVSNMFKETTKEISYRLDVYPNSQDGSVVLIAKDPSHNTRYLHYEESSWSTFLKLSDESLAKKFVKLLKLFKEEDKITVPACKLVNKIDKIADKEGNYTYGFLEFVDNVYDLAQAKTKKVLEKDPVLRPDIYGTN